LPTDGAPTVGQGATRIRVIFTSEGLQGECQIFSVYHPDRRILSNEDILAELQDRCEGIQLSGSAKTISAKESIGDVMREKENLHGLLVFGSPPGDLVSQGLPMVAVYPLWGQWMCPFSPLKGKGVLTSFLPVVPDNDEAIFSSRLDDIAGKLGLVRSLTRLRGMRVLVLTDRPILGQYEPMSLQVEGNREAYEEAYLKNLAETVGMELVVVEQEILVRRMNTIPDDDSERVARGWISESRGMRGTNEEEVAKSARLYLAMRSLMDEYCCQAITTEGYTVFQYYKGGPIPSQGLPASQLYTEGIVATSETLIDSLVTQQLGLFVTGSTGFNGDYLIDPFQGIAVIGHCECPFNPLGGDSRVPFVLRNLPLWEENKGGACVQVDLPVGETVTVAKVSVHDKKISLFTGKTVSGEELFSGWDDILCRTKLAIQTDAKALFENVDWKTFGNHRVAFYGDYREKFKDLASLMGYETVEDDGGALPSRL
jgi:hypothetical protein